MRYLFYLLFCLLATSCGKKQSTEYRQGYFYLTAASDSGLKKFSAYDREIQFNEKYIVGFKRGFDQKQVLREVYEVNTHRLYRFLTHKNTWLVYVEEKPEDLINIRTDVADTYYDSRIVARPGGNKTIKGFETRELLYRDREGRPKKMYVAAVIPFYLGHIGSVSKHIQGMPIEIREDSGLDHDVVLFSMTYFDPNVNEAAFSTSETGYTRVGKEKFEEALLEVIKENFSYTDIGSDELTVWQNNLQSLFLF